ncbi:MAG TPA: tetratricopeptide repeat protein, partial [Pirellulales bacterium]|nr:tetratricopeptide repeat protein [Pirellulales bacterium]
MQLRDFQCTLTVLAAALLLAGCNRSDSSSGQPTHSQSALTKDANGTASTTTKKAPQDTAHEVPARTDRVALNDPAADSPERDATKPNAATTNLETAAPPSTSGKKASDAVGTEVLSSPSDEKVSSEAREHYNKALELAKNRQAAAAKDEFTEALRIQPDYDTARSDFGKFLLDQGDTITASIVYRDGVKLHPNDSDAHNNYGVVLIRASDVAGARREFEKAIALKDENAQAHHNLGVLLSTLGELDQAIDQYKTAIHLKPVYIDARFDFGRALMRKGKDRLEDAVAQFREVLRLQPAHFGALYNLGLTLTMLGRSGDAIK